MRVKTPIHNISKLQTYGVADTLLRLVGEVSRLTGIPSVALLPAYVAAGMSRKTLASCNGADLLTTVQAAEYLGVKPKTLENWRWSGKGPAFSKVGNACRYSRSELDRYLKTRQFGSTSEYKEA